MKFRRRNPPVEAKQFDGTQESVVEIISWLQGLNHRATYHKAYWGKGQRLVLRIPGSSEHVAPNEWVVADAYQVKRLSDEDFHYHYEPEPDPAD